MSPDEALRNWQQEFKVTAKMLSKAGLSSDGLLRLLREYDRQQGEYSRVASSLAAWFHDAALEKYVHSVRYRTNDPVHLSDKVYRKATDRENPKVITAETLCSLVTDLSGVRVILLFRNDWEYAHHFHPESMGIRGGNCVSSCG